MAQNEDCKYFIGNTPTRGRINNILSHLTVISFFRDKIGLSKVIDSFNRTGVAPLPTKKIPDACGDLVALRNLGREKLEKELEESLEKREALELRLERAKELYAECEVGLRNKTKSVERELRVAQNLYDKITEKIQKIRENLMD